MPRTYSAGSACAMPARNPVAKVNNEERMVKMIAQPATSGRGACSQLSFCPGWMLEESCSSPTNGMQC